MINLDPTQTPQNAPAQEIIFDCGVADFEDRVMKASKDMPVIADFWSPTCVPCKTLTPMLEAAVRAAGGEVLLAKINLDENQQLAAALQIQSVPTVYGFFGGRPVDGFQGAISEGQLKEFITKLISAARGAKPDALDIPETLQTAAQALSGGDLETAQDLYTQILQQDQLNAAAYAGIIRSLIAGGALDQAAMMIENAPDEIAKQSALTEAKTALELAQGAPVGGDYADLQAAVDKNADDHQARYDLAVALFAAGGQEGAREDAVDHLMHIIGAAPEWNEQAARSQLLKFFEALGHSDPLTMSARRRLSSILFS